jgi:hypothetical protein
VEFVAVVVDSYESPSTLFDCQNFDVVDSTVVVVEHYMETKQEPVSHCSIAAAAVHCSCYFWVGTGEPAIDIVQREVRTVA